MIFAGAFDTSVKIKAVSPFNAGINSAKLLSLALSIAFLSNVFFTMKYTIIYSVRIS